MFAGMVLEANTSSALETSELTKISVQKDSSYYFDNIRCLHLILYDLFACTCYVSREKMVMYIKPATKEYEFANVVKQSSELPEVWR